MWKGRSAARYGFASAVTADWGAGPGDVATWRGGLPMDAPGVGIGQNDGFIFQARAFLEEVAGIPESESLPRNADFADGLRNMLLLDAVAQSAAQGGATVPVGI